MNTVTTRERIVVEAVHPVLLDFLAWSEGREDRYELQDDYVAVWHACDQIQRQRAARNPHDAAREAAWPELRDGSPM